MAKAVISNVIIKTTKNAPKKDETVVKDIVDKEAVVKNEETVDKNESKNK